MKKYFVFVVLLLTCIGIFSEQLDGNIYSGEGEGEPSLVLEKNSFEFYPFLQGFPEYFEGTYRLTIDNQVPIIEFTADKNIKMVFLYNKYFAYISSIDDKSETGIMSSRYVKDIGKFEESKEGIKYIETNYQVKASSSLKEKEKVYNPENLKFSAIKGPWVEGVEGSGIGEYLDFDFTNSNNKRINGLLVSNGFVSGKNTSLFLKNNRVKEIEFSSDNPVFSMIYKLNDEPNIQIVKLPYFTSKLKMTIKSIYKGTQFDDTCLNFVFGINGLN